MDIKNISPIQKRLVPDTTNYQGALVTLITLFFMWGFITCMNDILIPHLKELFELSHFEAMLVQFSFFGAYFTGSLIYFLVSYYKGDPVNKVGYKKGIIWGLILSALGCILFYPAATLSVYGLFLAALFVLGIGFTLLQITANVYVALLGTHSGASSRLNLAQAFNSLGTTLAPVIGGLLIFRQHAGPAHLPTQATRIPYLVFACIFCLVAVIIYKVKLPTFHNEISGQKGIGALAFPHLRLGIIAIFCYVGAEVAIGSFMISFLGLEKIMGLSEAAGKNYLAIYWGGAMIGRFLGSISLSKNIGFREKLLFMILTSAAVFGVILGIIELRFAQVNIFLLFLAINLAGFVIGQSAGRTLLLFALVNIVLVSLSILNTGPWAMWPLLSVGLFNSVMWSNIFTLSISGLGKHANQGSSLLIMAILGGALIPLLQGGVADAVGVQYSLVIPVLCYSYIACFGFYCNKKLKPAHEE